MFKDRKTLYYLGLFTAGLLLYKLVDNIGGVLQFFSTLMSLMTPFSLRFYRLSAPSAGQRAGGEAVLPAAAAQAVQHSDCLYAIPRTDLHRHYGHHPENY